MTPLPLSQLTSWLLDACFPARKALRELQARWGKPGDKPTGSEAGYFDLVRDPGIACVDDKTWNDLEFPRIFPSLDTTVTPVGSQVLYRQMHEYADAPDVLAARHALHVELGTNAALRERLQRRLLPLQPEHHARIAGFLFGPPPPPVRHLVPTGPWVLASLAVLAGALAWPWLLWPWLAMVSVNVLVLARAGLGGRVTRDMQTLQACLQLAGVADDLATLHARHPDVPLLAALQGERPQRARFRKPLGWMLMWTVWSKVFPIMFVVAPLNALFLVEPLLHARAMRRFAELRYSLAASFEFVGAIDAALAVASWWQYRPGHCRPTLVDVASLEVKDGQHPLLPDGVANSIRLDGRSLLVTGSNMAGKTTFIKMLAVNVVLGRTLGFCLAASATIPRAQVMASIQAAHSVAAGKSHYFSEVETIQSLLAAQARGGCAVFVIDELFSGTNTIERVAIARAVLEALSRGSLVLATTHDVELQAMLATRYDLCHFQEDPAVAGYFDYRLRVGPATERNAIRLLKEIGFPRAVVDKALAYAAQDLPSDGGLARAAVPLH